MQHILLASAFLGLMSVAGVAYADDAANCAAAKTEADSENASAPAKVDDVTTLKGAAYDCTAKTFTISVDVSVESTKLNEGWQQSLTDGFTGPICGVAAWHDAIAAGWTVTELYSFADGVKFSAVAKCPS
jgi:hypothetical protein